MTTPTETAVLAANRLFYDAFTNRSIDIMMQAWAREHIVACIHPGWDALHGRDAVLASWRAILESPEAPKVRFSEPSAVIIGEVAVVTCIEHIGDTRVSATNVFVLEGGAWRLVHHHAGPIMAPVSGPSRAVAKKQLN